MKAIGYIVVALLSVILTGFVTSVLWGWFLVPLGVAAISVPQAIGVGVLIQFLTADTTEKKNTREFGDAICIRLAMSGMALLIGWVVHGLM